MAAQNDQVLIFCGRPVGATAAYLLGRHVNNPLGDMELNGGLRDTIGLCGRLALVWHGNAPETVRDGYDIERWPGAISAINAITERNEKLMEERAPRIRARIWRTGAHWPWILNVATVTCWKPR